jgi:signal transduction histidine kinase
LGLLLEVECPETLRWCTDASAWERILGNLIDNAFRHTAPGGRVSIELSCIAPHLRLTVKDTGEGIPQEHLSRLFDRFYRVDKARSPSQGGAGIGLSIVRVLVESLNGKIRVNSQVGIGTTFHLEFRSSGDST